MGEVIGVARVVSAARRGHRNARHLREVQREQGGGGCGRLHGLRRHHIGAVVARERHLEPIAPCRGDVNAVQIERRAVDGGEFGGVGEAVVGDVIG